MASLFERAIHPFLKHGEHIAIPRNADKGPSGISRKFAVLPHQMRVHNHLNEIVTHVKDNTPAATAFTGGNNEVIFRIRQDACGRMIKNTLRIKITESAAAAMQLLPIYRWFDRIEFRPEKGDEEQYRLYGDSLEELLRLSCTDEELKSLGRLSNINGLYYNGAGCTHKASEVKWYSMPFPSIFDMVKLNPRLLKTDYRLRIYVKTGIVASGSGTPQLTDIELISEVENDNHNVEHVNDAHFNTLARHVPLIDFYEPQLVEEQSVALASSTKYRVNLDSVRGDVGFMTLRVRSSTANASYASMNNVDLGPNALIDIESSTNKSLWSNGINGDYLLFDLARKFFPNNYCGQSYTYIIPFCDNPLDAMFHGVSSGYMKFSDKKYLAITPDAAPVSWVYTVALSNSTNNDGGTIAFSDPLGNRTADLAYNTSTANLKAALDALPFFAENGLTSTFGSTAVDDFTITITGRDLSLMEGKSIGVHSKLFQSTNASSVSSVTVSTIGRRGFTSGSYIITVYCWTHNQLADLGYTLVRNGKKN